MLNLRLDNLSNPPFKISIKGGGCSSRREEEIIDTSKKVDTPNLLKTLFKCLIYLFLKKEKRKSV